MIEVVKIRNFRCLRDVEVELKPLTIFIGPNGSGKSSILYAIYWFVLKSLHNPALTGPCSDIEQKELGVKSYSDLALGRDLGRDWMEIILRFRIREEDVEPLLGRINWDVFGIRKPRPENFVYGFGIRQNAGGGLDYRVYIAMGSLILRLMQVYDEFEGTTRSSLKGTMEVVGENEISVYSSFHYDLFGDVYLRSKWEKKAGDKERKELEKVDRLLVKVFSGVKSYLESRFFFVKCVRGNIPVSSEAKTDVFVGTGERVLNVLARIYASPDPDVRREFGGLMSKWAEEFGLKELIAGLERDGIKARYVDLGKLDLALSSYGQRQLVTFLAQLVASPRESFIMIEEPELSLHPEAQMKLPLLFGEIIKRHKKKVVITTHSPVIPLALSDAVVEGLLRVEDIAVYHVERDERGYSKVKKIDLTREGYPKGGVPSFAKVEAELYRKIMERLE